MHQQIVIGDAATIVGQITDYRGEFTIVVGPLPPQVDSSDVSDEDIYGEFCSMTNSLPTRRAAIAVVAKKYGRTTKEIYAAIERRKGSGE
jgi:hypothetical protein